MEFSKSQFLNILKLDEKIDFVRSLFSPEINKILWYAFWNKDHL